MPRSIRQFVIMAVAIGVAVVGATVIGVAAAQSAFEQAKKTTHSAKSPVSETDFRIGHHQQLRNIFFGGDRLR
jgi:hypothetical protein